MHGDLSTHAKEREPSQRARCRRHSRGHGAASSCFRERTVFVLLCATVLLGCLDFGESAKGEQDKKVTADAGVESTARKDAGEARGDGALACPEQHVCVPAAPAGWNGPVALQRDQPEAECGDAYPLEVLKAYDALEPEPAQCSCSCAPPVDVECGPMELAYLGLCGGLPRPWQTIPRGECYALDPPPVHEAAKVQAKSAFVSGSGRCEPTLLETLPPPSWATSVRICAQDATAQTCNGSDVCMPEPAPQHESSLCIWRDVDGLCPSDYSSRYQYYLDVVDGRDCTECTCGSPEGVKCDGKVHLWETPDCPEQGTLWPLHDAVATDGCIDNGPHIAATAGPIVAKGGNCSPQGGRPIGALAPARVVTVCCL